MYGKIFAQIYDGSLYGHWQALVTFQQMIVLAEQDGTLNMTPQALAARTSIPLEIIQAGIEELERPDADSRTPTEEGRRIVRLSEHRSWGWRIVNFEAYNKLRSAEERREYMKQYQRERRKQESTSVNSPSTPSTPTSTDIPTSVETTSDDSFERFWSRYPRRAGGNPKKDALRCWHARLKDGYTADVIMAGLDRYAAFVRATDRENTEFVMQAKRFLGPALPFLEEWTPPTQRGAPQQPRDNGTGEAAELLDQIRALAQTSDPIPGRGQSRYIVARHVEEKFPEPVVRAYRAIGGSSRLLDTPGDKWGMVIRDFTAALAQARRTTPQPEEAHV